MSSIRNKLKGKSGEKFQKVVQKQLKVVEKNVNINNNANYTQIVADSQRNNKENGISSLKESDNQILQEMQIESNGKIDDDQGLLLKSDVDQQKTEIELQKIKEGEKEKDKGKQDKFEQALNKQGDIPTDNGKTNVQEKKVKEKRHKIKGFKTRGGKDNKNNKDTSTQQDSVDVASSTIKKEVKTEIKQNDLLQEKALKMKLQQQQLETKKKYGKQDQTQKSEFSIKNLFIDNLLIRKSWRILLLVLIVALILALIVLFYYSFGFIRGSLMLGNNEKVVMNLESCSLMVYDYSLKSKYTLDVNFLSASLSIPSSVASDQNVYLQYIFPNSPLQENSSKFSQSQNNGIKTLEFKNKLNSYECEIVMFVYKQTQFQSLDINCGDKSQCNIIFYSQQLSTTTMNIKGLNVQMNAPYLQADAFTYLSMKGSIEIPFFVFKTANINTREGDISVQSTSDITLTYKQKDPYNCLSAKKITDQSNNELNLDDYQNSIQFEPNKLKCDAIYPWGLKQAAQTPDKVIEYRCYSNSVILVNDGKSKSTLTASNSYGNIFVNVISAQGQFSQAYSTNNNIVFNKASKTDNQDNNKNIDYINFSNLAKINLLNQTKSASNPKVYDPMFVFEIGPKYTRSATFQQVQFSYNPAYSYMKPYWLGELTLTLMTTKKYSGQYTISPGFCPYIPSISLERIQSTQQMITNFMQQNSAPQQAIASNAWQPYIDYPPQKFVQTDTYNGFKDVSLNRNSDEQWIGVDSDQSKDYSVTNYDVSYSSSLYAAIIVSCVLSGILGIILTVILVFAINQNYIWVLNHISSVRKYSELEKGGAGEIDESTLDIHKRRFYLEYKEEQQKKEEKMKKALQKAGENPENKEQGFVPNYTISGIFTLFYQLIYLSPPLSAFIDYVVLLLHKAKQNSIKEFYKLLFRSKKLKELKENEDEEIHSLEKDQILGNEMKQLYEKFCYLNQYLERKFDDEENLKYLTEMGFKIVTKFDAQTQYFTYIKYNGNILTVSEQPNKTSLDLFISYCCSLTKFETDRIESIELENYYSEFCVLNHMSKIQLNEGSLKREYGISTVYLPQQWVERDEKYVVQKLKKKYYIDKKRVENNFKILLAKNSTLFSMLYDTEDFKQAQRDIQAATGWQFYDLITVVAHVLVMTLIGCPLIVLAIFIRAQQSSYSLIPPMRLIFLETINYYPTSLPTKLINDNWLVQAITYITLIFWALSFWDLIYYYASMDFPQEKYFNKYKKVGKFRKFLSGIMWIIVLISFYTFAVYFSLVAVWLMLSAIINPNAFLPYATSAATFVTLVAKKYKDFQEISQNGFKIISDYLQQMATGQFQDLLQKMNIQDKIADMVPTDTLKDITAEASKLGIIDASTSEEIQNNLEIMIRDPTSVSKLGQEIVKISQDPQAYAQQISQKLEDKAKAIIQQQINTIDKDIRDELTNLIWCLLKNQKSELKNSISSFVNALINLFQKKQGQQLLKSIGFVNLKGPVFDFVWEFAFPQENFKGNYQDHLINVFCVAVSNMISVWNKQLKSIISIEQQIVQKQNENKEKGNKKIKKNQISEKSEQQLLKEKLLKDIENADSAMQADIGQEDEQEIELTSEEAIAYAYKNIIFSVIQICRSMQSSNSEVILNQILNLVQNGSKLPGFDGLNQIKQYQDIFKIGYAIFKNDGEVDFEEVSSAFKGFFKNIGLENQVKEIAGVGILDVLKIVEVIIQSFKGQSMLMSSNTIKKAIQNLLGSVDFVSKRAMIRKQEFKDVKLMTSGDECLKMKDDITNNLNETKAAINDLEQQRIKTKQNEESYQEKLEYSLYYLRYYCKELLQQRQGQPGFNQAKVDQIDGLSGEKVIQELEQILQELKKNNLDKKKIYTQQKQDLMKKYANLKKEKTKQQDKMNDLNAKIDSLQNKIRNDQENNLKEKDKKENQKDNDIKEHQKKISQTKQLINQKSIRINQIYQIKMRNIEWLEDYDEYLIKKALQEEKGEINEYNPNQGDVQEFAVNTIHVRNRQLIQHPGQEENQLFIQSEEDYDSEWERQQKEEEKQYIKEIQQIFNENRDIDSEINKIEQEIYQLEDQIIQTEQYIQDIENQYARNIEQLDKQNTSKKEEEEIVILQKKYENEKDIYDETVNKISEYMAQQEEIENEIKQNDENINQYINDNQYYMEEFKSSQKVLNKAYQDKIEYHEKIDDLQEKKIKFEQYLIDLEQRYKIISEELKKKSKQDEDKEKQKAKIEALEKEDNDNYLSSGITVMLNFFSGSISGLQADLLKELGSFFGLISDRIQSEEIKQMFKFLKSQILDDSDNQKGKSNNKGLEKINNFQSILNLLDIFLNDSIIASDKILKNGKDNLLESEVVKSLQILFTSRFEGFTKQKTIDNYLKGSDLLELISKVMKMREDTILGFMKFLFGQKTCRDARTFINFTTQLNKIKEDKVHSLLHLYNLYSSKNPNELFDALSFFQVTKNVSNQFQTITVKDLVSVLLFMRGSLEFNYVKTIIEVKLNLVSEKDKKEQSLNQVLEIKERIKSNQNLPSHFKKLFEIEIKGYLQANTLQADFKDINRNYEILLEQADFNFFKKFSSIRNIPIIEDASQNTLVKSSISDISDILNIDYQQVELFINLLTSSKAEKIKQSLDMLQILKINPKSDENRIKAFAQFSASVLEKIEQKCQNIQNISKNIFSDKLHVCLLRKILYHEGAVIPYTDYLDIFNIYCDNNIPKSITNLINFRYGITGNRKRDIYNFLNPFRNNSDKDYKKFKKSGEGQQGLIKAVQILSINDEAFRVQQFLQFLINTNQEALLMASCLIVYFSGRSSNVALHIQDKNDKRQKKVNVEQMLCILLKVKQEFFEAFHTYFQEDISYCAQTMIKFYRQLDYLKQQADGDENTVLQNNITISDKNVEQYLRLVNHMQFNTSYVSKDTNIPIEAVELVSNLMYIKNSKNEQERNAIFESMRSNTYIQKLFQQLGVNHYELVALIKIMYQDYEPSNIKWISKSLKLPPQFKIDGLQQLAMIDQILPIYGESSQNKKQLANLIKTNKFIKIFKIDTTWAEVAYILCKGDFCLLSKYQDVLIPLKYPSAVRFEQVLDNYELQQSRTLTQAVNAKEKKYISLVQGLVGLLSCRYSSFKTTEFLYQLYTKISQKYVKDEHVTIEREKGIKKGNTLQYAIYKFTKSTLMSPVWTLLMMGDQNTWEFLAQSHYFINDKKKPYLNPILALVYVLNFRSNPLILKQLLVDLEYAQRCYQIYVAKLKAECLKMTEQENKQEQNQYSKDNSIDEEVEEYMWQDIQNEDNKQTDKDEKQISDQQKKLNELQKKIEEFKNKIEEFKNKIEEFKNKINLILFYSLEKDGEKLIQIAEEFNFPKKVIQMILVYEDEYKEKVKENMEEEKKEEEEEEKEEDEEEEQEQEEDEDEEEIRLTTSLIKKAFKSLKRRDMQQLSELETLNKVFEQIGTYLYTDPRRERMNLNHEETNFTNSYCLHTHTSSPIMQMIVLSTISQLKLSYYDFYGFNGRDEDHYKQVTFAIDLILGTLEKYYYFDDMMDFFPRHRLIPLIGLSVGFIIESDDILSSMTSSNIFGQSYFTEVIIQLCYKVYNKQYEEEQQNGEDQKLNQQKFQKFIELHKFNLKLNYFIKIIVDYNIAYQLEYNYSQTGIFRGISQEDVLFELQLQNLDRLIDNYDEMMWDCFENKEILYHITDSKSYSTYTKRGNHIDRDSYDQIDHYSGEKKKDLFEYLDNYTKVAETENFKFMIDIYKENYKSLNDNDYFSVNYGQDSNMYFGTLNLNGIIQQQMKEIKMEEFSSHVTQASLYMTSNKKVLAEILSLLIPSIKSNFTSLNEQLNISEENLSSFINLAMSKSIDQTNDLKTMLNKSSLSDSNIDVLDNCMSAYQGDMSECLDLIYHSSAFKKSAKSIILFTKFFWSFEESSMHKNTNNPYEINYFNYCNLSPDRSKALKKAQKYLWKISQNICYQNWIEQNPKKNKISFEDYKLKQIYKGDKNVEDNHMSSLLQKILYNDWNFLISQEKEQLQYAFNVIFNTNNELQCLEKLQILALLKPQESGLKVSSENLDDYVNCTKVDNMIRAGGDLFSNPSEARHLHLLLSLSNNSIVHILNCLNTSKEEWNFDFEKEQEEVKINGKVAEYIIENKLDVKSQENQIFQKYNSLKKEALENLRIQSYIDESEGISSSKYLSYILQSLFLWKNISNIKWDDVFKNSQAFLNNPYQFKESKNQIDFLLNYIQYLSILPAFILDKVSAKSSPSNKRKDASKLKKQNPRNTVNQEETYVSNILKQIKFKSLDTEIFTRHIAYESNSIYLIYQSYENVVSQMGQIASDYASLCKEDEEEEEIDQETFREKLKEQICSVSTNIYYMLNFLNGNFLKEIVHAHPLIEYLSNLYFKGLQAIHTQKTEPIDNYLQKCIDDENSFINIILKENPDYAFIFIQVLNITFTISFCTTNDSKIDRLEKDNILNLIDQLLLTVGRDLLQIDENIVNLIYAVFYLITNQETKKMKENSKFKDKQNCLIILLKVAFENPDLSDFFFGSPKTGESAEQIDKMISTITNALQSILDKPSQSINDSDLVKEVLKLLKYASKGNLDVSIIEDVISILTGDHQRVFNILKKFEIADENKIALIQRAYSQVVDMPIFSNQDKAIVGSSSTEQSDKMKEVVKKLQEGKVTIKDVFIAVDAEGDNNGTISIDEFQSFVRRLGMELSRHRVNEIFAHIKNKKLNLVSVEKTDELTLNVDEFEKAFKYVNEKKTSMSLEKLGISPALLVLALGTLIVILILVFVFIFFGINAFAMGGTFGSIINSLIPMAAAGGVAGSQENKQKKLKEEEVSNAVSQTQAIIHSKNI
ncbi:phage head-tail adaptor family protein, putative (macronuclear) [Tetrahymena thermophila SB210]|uniref:Phage head-tail adaptor family protein, putative n=1 Tax=Tetrahymena thermophila (strain SB210) TaxID=312017 RepID=Q22M50_TETTS|nr:phage head-tail adaptor family protein, putative [Tetrahymena thermophila SB210]EAR86318.2 phage head-tail adaptor family protein, putative [Tetrahymena thermophila SB210]|eukprot:XP_977170.2 phage head-tail adaptor family protein, putative [Tetrahymena thermophila SB210]